MKRGRIKNLNEKLVKDKKALEFAKKVVFSRVIFNFLILLFQIILFAFFILELSHYIEFYLAGSLIFSTIFMIYLSNCKGKNEFKLIWLIPVSIMPLFGLASYIMYHTNPGGKKVSKKLEILKAKTNFYLDEETAAKKNLLEYPEVKDLGLYLYNRGNFFPHINNQVNYFSCGEEFFKDFLENLEKAEKYIFLEYFIIAIDESWDDVLRILEKKAKEGVEVRVLYDGFGSIMASTKEYQRYLKSLQINSHVFLKLIPFFTTQQNNRDHRKIAIIDGKIAYTGGLNLSNQYFNYGKNRFSYWKDNAIRIEGPAIKNLLTMFLQTWNLDLNVEENFEKYLEGDFGSYSNESLVIPYGDDWFNNEDIAENVYSYILDKAEKYVHITSPYIILDNNLMRSIIFAAHRGLEVSIVVPSMADHFIAFCIGKTYLRTLIENGVHVYLYNRGFIHQKTFIADDKLATIGSVNLDYRSLIHHFECGTVLYKDSVVNKIEEDFVQILTDCKEMSLEDYRKLPFTVRLVGRLFRIVAPLF